MQINVANTYSTLLAALAIVVSINIACKRILFSRLRRGRRRLWKELGEPSLLRERSWRETMDRPRIVWTAGMTRLAERSNVQMVYLARITDIVGAILFIALMLSLALL